MSIVERATYGTPRPLSNDGRKRLYRARLAVSPLYDEHEHARRVADGLRALARLHAHWLSRRAPEPQKQPALKLIRKVG